MSTGMSTGALAALAGLPSISPSRLRILLAHHAPGEALELLAAGRGLHPMCERGLRSEQLAAYRAAARSSSPAAAADACAQVGAIAVPFGADEYPVPLVHDPEAPAVLFVRGDLTALDARRVGIVGTRHCSAAGRSTAADLGAALAAEGVAVVSGLARGIDAAAHRGVRSVDQPDRGRPVAVVGSGIDVTYPKQNAGLWEWVAGDGVLISEWPPGVAPDAWRFPQRNRILAGLCEVLVVVESRERGGSLITARAAADRGVEIMAVPGSPRSRASAGTNQLLVDGVAPVTSVDDVFAALGLDHRRQGKLPFDPRPVPTDEQQQVLRACELEPSNLDMIVRASGLPVATAAMAAARLESSGWLVEAGGWFEPVGSRLCAR